MDGRLALLLIAIVLAPTAFASDGVLEINQTCAKNTGCFAGDEPGFPVQITHTGSYRLTSNLTFSVFNADQTVSLISISASDVTLDLGGFAVSCFKNSFVMPEPGRCSGGGRGIESSVDAVNVVVRNGTVRGMGSSGVRLVDGEVENVRAFDNGFYGIGVELGEVRSSRAEANGNRGINVDLGTVDGCRTLNNGAEDIFADGVRDSFYQSSFATPDLGGNRDLPE